jgi:hypothetical protein
MDAIVHARRTLPYASPMASPHDEKMNATRKSARLLERHGAQAQTASRGAVLDHY